MKFVVHAEHPVALHQALLSRCDGVRYGADLCEFKLPNDLHIREFLKVAKDTRKDLSYVCPRLPEQAFKLVEQHLAMINDGTARPVQVIANDWGVLNQLIDKRYPNLIPYIGRQLVAIPSRGRPSMADLMGGESLFKRMAIKKVGGIIFNKTNLHFRPTVTFLKECGVAGADIDWVPSTFPEMRYLVKAGLRFSVHMGLVIVAVVRRCHTARYFNEPIPAKCSMPCFKTAFLLKHEIFGDLYMDGNTIFAKVEPTLADIHGLSKSGAAELVLTMGPMTKIQTAEEIDARIAEVANWMGREEAEIENAIYR